VGVAWALLGARPSRPLLLCLVGIPALAGVLFMIYNMLRYSGPLDFGNQWQLAGRDVRELPLNDLANLPPSLYGYLIAPPRLGLDFPFLHLPPPPDAPLSGPEGFHGEPTASVLWALPFALLAIPVLLRGRRSSSPPSVADAGVPRAARRVVAALLVVAAAGLVPGAIAMPGYTERYELDFLPYLVMAATLGWAVLVQGAATPRRAAWWRRAGLALAAWSVLFGVAIGFTGYYDSFKQLDGDRFRALERAFSPLPTLATALGGGPAIADVAVPGGVTELDTRYTKLSWDGMAFDLAPGGDAQLTIVSPSARDAVLRFEGRPKDAGAVAVPPAVVQIGAGPATSVTVSGGAPVSLPLRLERGVNHITLSADGGAVALRDVRVR